MNSAHWTSEARAELDRLLEQHHARLVGTGVDADEVIADLRRHLETELGQNPAATIEATHVRGVLEPLLAESLRGGSLSSGDVAVPVAKPPPRLRVKPLLWFLWVVLPLMTVAFESIWGPCAETIADPLRTPGHYLVLLGLPALLGYVLATIERAPMERLPRLLAIVGFACGVGLYFTVQLAQAVPIGLFALIAFGLGLLALSPLLLTVSAALGGFRLRRMARAVNIPVRIWPAVLGGIALMLAIDARWFVTEVGLRWAASNDVEMRERGLELLRSPIASEDQMLRAGIFQGRSATFGAVLKWVAGKPLDPWATRNVYFAATGRNFETEIPDDLIAESRWGMRSEDGSWRGERPLADDLVLGSSRLDGIAMPDALVGYVEWIAVVENHRQWDREGWATLQLPPGGVVSRVTLWINGEEREAAFGGRAQTIRAYEAVTARRRDPLLVTSAGPDRVNLRFFPVPRQGSMKFRIGITFPMTPASDAASASVELPRLLDTNLFVSPKFAHEVWYEAHAEPLGTPVGMSQEQSPKGEIALRGALRDASLATTVLRFHRNPETPAIGELNDDPKHHVLQLLQAVDRTARPRTLVLDGSPRFLREQGGAIAEVLRKNTADGALRLVVALDEPLSRGFSRASEAGEYLRSALRAGVFSGADGRKHSLPHRAGFDNRAALTDAVRRLAGTDGTVVWVHGPQLPRFDVEPVLQVLARRDARLNIVELAADPERVRDWGGLEEKLAVRSRAFSAAAFEENLGGVPGWEIVRKPHPNDVARDPEMSPFPKESRHITRLWAADEAMRMVRADASQRDAAMKLAIGHQVVTPLSGAVVLETQKQYDEHGLKPADPKTVPVVPEPQTYAFMLAAMGGALLWRRWQQQRRRAKTLCVCGS